MSSIKITVTTPHYETPLAPETSGSSGIDLRAAEAVSIPAGQSRLIETGFRVVIPEGYEGQVRPRSGLAYKNGVTVLNAPGTIDSDYREDIGVILVNHGHRVFPVKPGMRIAQIVFTAVAKGFETISLEAFEAFEDTERGGDGFGSTGTE